MKTTQNLGHLEFLLLPDQVPRFWEAIKFAYVKVGNYREDKLPQYLHKLLVDLLSGKVLCFIVLNKDRYLATIAITRIIEDQIIKERTLFVDALYSFQHASEDEWIYRFVKLLEFAKRNDCTTFSANTKVERMYELAKYAGVEEQYRCYTLNL